MSDNVKNVWKFIASMFCSFYLVSLLVIFIKYILKMNITSTNDLHVIIVNISYSIIFTAILVLLYLDILKKGISEISKDKKNLLKFLKKVFAAFAILMGIKFGAAFITGIISKLIGLETSVVENQNSITRLLGSAPIAMITLIVFIGPIEEELFYRGSIRKLIKNKKVYITVSGLIFGLVHVTDSKLLFVELLLLGVVIGEILDSKKYANKVMLSVLWTSLILIGFGVLYFLQFGNLIVYIKNLNLVEVVGSLIYISMGWVLGYYYVKEDNIIFTIMLHMIQNGLGVVLSYLLILI